MPRKASSVMEVESDQVEVNRGDRQQVRRWEVGSERKPRPLDFTV